MNTENIKFDKDSGGIVTLTWDMPGRSMNVLNSASMADFRKLIEAVVKDDSIKGVVITSGKPAFMAGADLDEMESGGRGDAEQSREERLRRQFEGVFGFNRLLRELETCGKPVAAAINGTALGGGLEVTLACHYRVVADDPKIQLGLPESRVGVLPGGGGTQRLPRLIGMANALPLMLQGTSLSSEKALKSGIVHKVVPAEQLIFEAK
ncbi:MAG: enoyl-CoA hydratase-related protein, partial [Alphaproteobacteria bacterium]